MFATVLHNP